MKEGARKEKRTAMLITYQANLKIIAVVFVGALAVGCGGRLNPIVQAQGPGALFTPPHQESVCPTGCIAMQSNPSFLELRFGPTNNTAQDGFSISLPFPMHVRMLDVWIGTQTGALFESDSRLQIIFPDGSWREFKAQYDKHQDVVGDVQRSFDVDLTLPAGTTLVVYHTEQGVISCPQQGCGYDATWSVQGL
jgi:hypothetical protein